MGTSGNHIPTLYLIRGIPGSGKSTLGKALASAVGGCHVEADMWFSRNGAYEYDKTQIENAHHWCQEQALNALRIGADTVVSNTFSRIWEMKPYLNMGYPVVVIECRGRWKNIHDCPEPSVQRMLDRWEPYAAMPV